MKKYPKVPRHDLEFVPRELFASDDLYLLEKMDGMNLRFTLYQDNMRNKFSDAVLDTNPSDGDIVFGSKRVIRGCISESTDNFDPELRPAIERLRELPKQQLRQLQDEYGVLTLYAEYMVPHTLDYNYGESPPPEVIGFDVYSPARDYRGEEDYPSNPYKEKFVGFLDVETSMEIFQSIGIEFAPIVMKPDSVKNFHPSKFEVPISGHANVKAEGVVIRSDTMELRSKYVRESFREMHKSSMGGHADKSEEPHQWMVDALVSPQRVRKTVRKMVISMGYEFSDSGQFIDEVTQMSLIDAWSEEFVEIQDIDSEITPSAIHEPARNRVENVIERMKMTSERTDQRPEDVWASLDKDDKGSVSTDSSLIKKGVEKEKEISMKVVNSREESEVTLINEIVGDETISDMVDEIDDVDGSDLKSISSQIEDMFWSSSLSEKVLWRLSVSFNPTTLRDHIINRVKRKIEEKADIDLDKGGDTWNPSNDDADFEGINEIL